MSDERQRTVSEQIEDIKSDICDHLCRYSLMAEQGQVESVDEMIEKYCSDCPLNRL